MLRCSVAGLVALAALGAVTPAVRACTRPMAMVEMAGYAAEVWTVRVDGVQSHWADNPQRIETELTLSIEEPLKGQRGVGERFTMTAPGGTVGDWEMRLCCAPQFEPGKSYVIFVLPEYRTYPTVGMSRGVFELVADQAGTQRVMTVDGDAVMEIGVDGLPVLARGHDVPKPKASQGVRVVDVPANKVMERAMTYEAFKAALEPVLAQSHAYPAGGPVARRVTADYSAVALVAANEGRVGNAPARVEARKQPVATAPPRAGAQDGGQP
ncbi:MAG: hypothetical protein KDA20_06645 [Phycisphaerales bacterium]|nr:hypothetical protein [Phycisphaerales bacterium]